MPIGLGLPSTKKYYSRNQCEASYQKVNRSLLVYNYDENQQNTSKLQGKLEKNNGSLKDHIIMPEDLHYFSKEIVIKLGNAVHNNCCYITCITKP